MRFKTTFSRRLLLALILYPFVMGVVSGVTTFGEGKDVEYQPVEIALPQWTGFTTPTSAPCCYYEINSGIYLGRSKQDGFVVSYDNGRTWESKNNGLPKKVVYPFDTPKVRPVTSLGIDPVNNERVAVTTGTELYLSCDQGNSWQEISGVPQGVYLTAVALSPHDPETIAIGTSYSGIYESIDQGGSWRRISGGLDFLMQSRYTEEISALTYHPEEAETLIFACGFGKGLYKLDTIRETATAFTLSPSGEGLVYQKGGEGQNEGIIGLHFRADHPSFHFLGKDDWLLEVVTAERKRSYAIPAMELRAEVNMGGDGAVLTKAAQERRFRAEEKFGLYVNYAWKRFEDHLPFIKAHKLNSIVVDFKNDLGYLTYDTKLSFPQKIGAVQRKIRLQELVKKAHENRVYIIGRIVAFKDRQLYKYKNHHYAVWDRVLQRPWREREYWVDPFSQDVWEYNIAIAEELVAMGVDEIQFDYIRFPTDGDLSRITYRHRRAGMEMIDALESFLALARERIKVPISIDLYGFNCWFRMQGRTGQDAEIFSNYVDVISPMFYPSHFPVNFYGDKSYMERARIIYEEGVARAHTIVGGRSLIRPYVQAFLLGREVKMKAPEYTRYLLEQIGGTLAAPSSGFTLWNNSNNYYMVKSPLGGYLAREE